MAALFALTACEGLPPGELGPAPDLSKDQVEIVARTPDMKTYPCVSLCHFEIEPNPAPRQMQDFHIGRVLDHGPTLNACSWCHDAQDYDKLSLLDGRRVSFDEAFELCGQCHGDKLRDWKVGVHGRQTGSWNGPKKRYACPTCHDPHRPVPMSLKAMPAPKPPAYGPGGMSRGH